jgi:hypothetical protein
MSMQKLPILGYFAQNTPTLPAGLSGTNVLTGAITAAPANLLTVVNYKLALTAANVIVLNGRCTVTATAHTFVYLGQQVTFSGFTGTSAGLNNQTWTIDTINSTTQYSFPCNVANCAGAGASAQQEPVFTMPQGFSYVQMYANAVIEFCGDNSYNSTLGYTSGGQPATFPTGSGTGWTVLYTGAATPVIGLVASDGFAVRMRCNGTTASSYITLVA